MVIKHRSAKAKGRRLQQWVAGKISDLLGIPWGPDELIASREGSQSGVDIRLVGEAKRMFPFSIECKSQETWSVPAWIKQAKNNKSEGTTWMLVCKKKNLAPVVVMDAADFFIMLDYFKSGIQLDSIDWRTSPRLQDT